MDNIRPAAIADAEAMSYIHARTWKAAYKGHISGAYLDGINDDKWIPVFTTALGAGICEGALYYSDTNATGCVTFGGARDKALSGYGEIISLYVLPECWSTGQGRNLMAFALEKLKARGFNNCYLWVLKQNARATDFYERYGFIRDGAEMAVNIDGQDLDEVRYSIRI